jgi:hypothetical protein
MGQNVGISQREKGAPGGVATLDGSAKINREQIQMAYETEEKFEEIEDAIANIQAPTGGINIDALTLAY